MGKWTDAALKRKKQMDDILLQKDHIIMEKDTEIALKTKQITDLKKVKS